MFELVNYMTISIFLDETRIFSHQRFLQRFEMCVWAELLTIHHLRMRVFCDNVG